MEQLISKLRKWKSGGKSNPHIAQVHLTNKCNLDCDFCPTVTEKRKGNINFENELSKERWKEIIKEGAEMGIQEWHICGGGEPFFDKKLALNLMKLIKKSGTRGEVITNGTLLDRETSKELVGMGWDLVTFSIDGPSEKVNDHIRSEGSFRKAVKNAKILSSMKRDRNPLLRIHTVICNKNYDKMGEMIELTKELGFDEIRFNSLNIWSEEGEKLKLDKDKIARTKNKLEEAKENANKLNVNTNIEEFIEHNLLQNANEIDEAMKEEIQGKGFSNLPCYYPWYNISIFSDGRIAPCFLFHESDSVKNKSLKEVWYGDFFEKIRKRFLNNDLKSVCKNCNAWNV
ncbi:MAG: radical SAM/SPASM domain-containing protein, partial [Candidatus Aenigmatarchaeota archaeon]